MTAFRYEWGKSENKAKSAELGRPFYDPAIFCRFVKKDGDIVLQVNKAFEETHLKVKFPNDPEHLRQVDLLNRALEDFKRNGSKEVSGTPIKEWPLVNAAEAENLRVVGIESVEQLADAKDEDLKSLGISKPLRKKAQEYLEHASDAGAAAERSTQLKEENEILQSENADLKKQVSDLQAQLKKEAVATGTTAQKQASGS